MSDTRPVLPIYYTNLWDVEDNWYLEVDIDVERIYEHRPKPLCPPFSDTLQ